MPKPRKSRRQCINCRFNHINKCMTIREKKETLNKREFLLFTIESYFDCPDFKRIIKEK